MYVKADENIASKYILFIYDRHYLKSRNIIMSFAAVTTDASLTSRFFFGFCRGTAGYTSNMPVDTAD